MRKLLVGLSILSLFGVTAQFATAQETSPAAAKAELLPENAEGEPELGAIQPATHLIGCEVVDDKQESIGRLTDIAVDLEAGRVVALVIKSSHAAEADQFAIPVRLTRSGVMTVTANISRSKLDKAPKIKHENKQKYLTRSWGVDLYESFGEPSLWKESDRLDYPLTMLSTLFGSPISNAAGKQLGRIEDAAILLERGLIGYLAVSMTAKPDDKNKLYSVPLSAFVVEPKNGKWILELPKDILADTPTFDANHWPEKVDRGWVEYVHVRYGQSPFAGVRNELHKEQQK